MRPLVAVRSHFRFPFDFAFGAPSGVRIIHALALHDRPLGTTEIDVAERRTARTP